MSRQHAQAASESIAKIRAELSLADGVAPGVSAGMIWLGSELGFVLNPGSISIYLAVSGQTVKRVRMGMAIDLGSCRKRFLHRT